MVTNICEKYFINPAIEYGIRSYIAKKNGEPYKRFYVFEMNVIKALTIIYGEKSILLPYKIDNEKAFECNLLIYDLKENDMKKFIHYMNDYYEFMKNFKSEAKATGLVTEIEKLLLEMINKRSTRREFSKEELQEFDKIFNPIEGDLKKLKNLVSSDMGLIVRAWQDNKYELTNTQLRMIAINPNLLNREQYAKFGFDIRTVATLSEEEINKINATIWNEENRIYEPLTHKVFKRKKKIVLTTGNGFVDKLMIVSIVATEIMIGIVIATIIGG